MLKNVRVKTIHGIGTIIDSEKLGSPMSYRFLVRLDNPELLDETLFETHTEQGGLMYRANELETKGIKS